MWGIGFKSCRCLYIVIKCEKEKNKPLFLQIKILNINYRGTSLIKKKILVESACGMGYMLTTVTQSRHDNVNFG